MAKKRRIIQKTVEEEEDSYEFVPPDFDEKEFILKDMYGTKVLIAVFVMAIISGILIGLLQFALRDMKGNIGLWLGLIIAVAVMVFMRNILRALGHPEESIEPKGMIGNYIMYALLTLGIWVLTLNILNM